MTTSLTYTPTVVSLSDDMQWPDEFTWRAVEQRKQYSVTGALLVESTLKKSGRTITLQADDRSAWISRATLVDLYDLAGIAGAAMTLVLRGQTFNVMFDHDAGAITATPVVDYSDPDDADHYVVTLRFIVVPT